MPIKVKVGVAYRDVTATHVKLFGTYRAANLYAKAGSDYADVSGGGPPPEDDWSLDFSNPDNSMYLALISVGGM